MKLITHLIYIFIIGLLAVVLGIPAYHTKDAICHSEVLQAKVDQLQYIHDVSVEFGFDPTIVEVVDRYMTEHFDVNAPSWRLLQTQRMATYFFCSMIYHESKGNPNAVGDNGKARGLTQIWYSTAKDYDPEIEPDDLFDIDTNIRISFQHYERMMELSNGNPVLAYLRWNRGEGTVARLLSMGDVPANGYAMRVFTGAIDRNRTSLWR